MKQQNINIAREEYVAPECEVYSFRHLIETEFMSTSGQTGPGYGGEDPGNLDPEANDFWFDDSEWDFEMPAVY